jgi:hypothetical protein
MLEEKDNVIEDVVNPQDVSTESSTEAQTEEATSPKATEKEPPFNEHPRWKELQEERRELREQNNRLQEQLFQIANNSRPMQPQIEEKIEEAATPEEREFWRKVDDRAEKRAEAKIKNLVEEFKKEKQVLYDQFGQMAAKEFLKDHANIQKGSAELKEIVNTARTKNLDLDDAYKLVMFDKEKEMAAENAKRQKQDQNKKKLAANVERGTVSTEAPIIQDPSDFDAVFNREIDSSGLVF